MSECLSDNGPAKAVALGKPVLETQSKMWVDDIQAECQLMAFATPDPKIEIIAVVKGTVRDEDGVPVRVHSECFTGDVLGSQRCDCGQQLHKFMRIMNDSACGVLLYIRGQEGRGIGLFFEDSCVPSSGPRSRHGGRELEARTSGGHSQLRGCLAGFARPRAQVCSALHEQSGQDDCAEEHYAGGSSTCICAICAQCSLPQDEEGEAESPDSPGNL
mmetsp:Transcript_5624/g.11529  ORF Transcript_5624/g.11529 Transcript_5624/m.11529 type:complete len:216 (-) Transcript_5624:528-1175(-)